MAEILTNSELDDIANGYFTEMRPNEIRERLLATCRALAAERDKLAASRRVHELDNHHNALACGYCSGPLLDELKKQAERIRTLESEKESLLARVAGLETKSANGPIPTVPCQRQEQPHRDGKFASVPIEEEAEREAEHG